MRTNVGPELGPVTIEILWSLVLPSDVDTRTVEQDLYLLWPSAVAGSIGPPEATLAAYIESRGLAVIDEGRLPLLAQSVQQMGRDLPPQPEASGAPFVTFVRHGGPLGLSTPATYVRIPWTPKLGSRDWLMDLRITVRELISAKKASWFENMFSGQRHLLSLSFNDVRSRALFPLYLEHRDRAVRLADEPAQILINFASADRLKIDEVSPSSAIRHPSESLENTEVVSHFLERSDGISPQVLTVQFAYFSGFQAWGPILIPTLFFVLGNLAGVLLRTVAERVGKLVAGRVHFGPPGEARPDRDTGVILSRETLARIAPGVTTYEEVVRLCGPDAEQLEQFGAPERRTLVYRGRRVVPQGRRMLRWFTTVSLWDIEHHEVEIQLGRDVVSDVRAAVRRSRRIASKPSGPGPELAQP